MYAFKVVTTVFIALMIVLVNIANIKTTAENRNARLILSGIFTIIEAMSIISIWL